MLPADSLRPVRSSDRLGRYEVLLPIASGGMASVYLAVGVGVSGFERQVAIKLIHPHLQSDPDLVDSLLNEGKLAVEIRHRNVVAVLDVGLDRRGMYLVMEYIEGDSLSALVRAARTQGSRIPDPIAVRILTDALAGLHAAHELRDDQGKSLNVVHRDFSPQNILVSLEGTALLTDFGIAKAATCAGHTQTGIVKGKVSYLAPEQVRLQPIDRRVDVWAAGVVAWELFAGRRLRPEGNQLGTLLEIVSTAPPLLRTIRPDIGEAIESAVAGALQIDPDRRFPTAKALRDALLEACPSRKDVADVDEVAAFVDRTVGAKLRERRERVSKVLEIRSRLGQIAREALTFADSADDLVAVDPDVLPLPRKRPGRPSDEAEAERPCATVPRKPLLSATFDDLPAPKVCVIAPVLPGDGAPSPPPLPSLPGPAPATDSASATAPPQVAAEPATDTISVTRSQIVRSRRRTTSLLAMAGLAIAILVSIALVLVSLPDDTDARLGSIAAPREDTHDRPLDLAASMDSVRAGDTVPPSPPLQRQVTFHADAPMVRVEHAGAVNSIAAQTTVSLTWPYEEACEARATDVHGRNAALRVPPGASTVYVRFAKPEPGYRRLPARSQPAPLASDPY